MKSRAIDKRIFVAGTVLLVIADRVYDYRYSQSEEERTYVVYMLFGSLALAMIGFILHEN